MKTALVSKDDFSRMYWGEIRGKSGQIESACLAKVYPEILTWAREHNARIVDLDVLDKIKDYL